MFTTEYVAGLTERWSAVSEGAQPIIARIALDPERIEDRARIEQWVARLHPQDRPTMAALLQKEDRFITAYGELVTAQVLMNAGLSLRYRAGVKGER